MYARMSTVRVRPDTLDHVVQVYTDGVIPALQLQDGFRGTDLLVWRDTSVAVSVTYWDSEADLRASEASGFYQEQVAKFSGSLDLTLSQRVFEVSARIVVPEPALA